MSRRLRWLLSGLLVAAPVRGTIWFRTRPVAVAVISPQRKDAIESLSFDGTVRPLYVNRFLCPLTYERVKRVLVAEGQVVRKGQPLVELDDSEARAEVARCRPDVRAAHSALAPARASAVKSYRSRLKYIEMSISDCWERKDKALADLDRARRDESLEGVRRAEITNEQITSTLTWCQSERLRLLDHSRVEDSSEVSHAMGGLAQAKRALAKAETRLAEMVLRSRISGLVLRRQARPGQYVTRYQPLMDIVEIGSLGVGVPISNELLKGGTVQGKSFFQLLYPGYARDRYDGMTQAVPGADALVKITTFPNKEFRGSVQGGTRIENGQNLVQISLEGAPAQIRPCMPAKVKIITERYPNAITLPRSAVVDASSNPAVFVVRDGCVARQPVKISVGDNPEVVVKKGIGDDETVVMHPDKVRVGQRVRPVLET